MDNLWIVVAIIAGILALAGFAIIGLAFAIVEICFRRYVHNIHRSINKAFDDYAAELELDRERIRHMTFKD